MKLGSACLALVLGALATSAEAAPFTFDFMLPPWTFSNDAAWFGTHASLAITVDNGGASPASQAYTFDQVTQLDFTTDGTSSGNWISPVSWIFPTTPTSPADTLFTTDAAGVATIDFDVNAVHYRIVRAPHDFLELDFGNDLLELCYHAPPEDTCATIEMVSSLSGVPSRAPEPALLRLLACGLAAGLARRRLA
jgi:hypothetical protein